MWCAISLPRLLSCNVVNFTECYQYVSSQQAPTPHTFMPTRSEIHRGTSISCTTFGENKQNGVIIMKFAPRLIANRWSRKSIFVAQNYPSGRYLFSCFPLTVDHLWRLFEKEYYIYGKLLREFCCCCCYCY